MLRPVARGCLGIAVAMLALTAQAITPEQEDAERIADLVIANHILADQGVLDGFGHISVRSAKNPSHYFIARSLAPALVTIDDIMEYDLDDQADRAWELWRAQASRIRQGP